MIPLIEVHYQLHLHLRFSVSIIAPIIFVTRNCKTENVREIRISPFFRHCRLFSEVCKCNFTSQ